MRTLVLVLLVVSSSLVGVGTSQAAKSKGPDDREFVDTAVCVGDAIPDDGVSGGVCLSGPLSGLPCDSGPAKGKGLSDHCGVRPTGVAFRSIAQDLELANQRDGVAGVGCPGPFPAPIALSISGRWHRTAGQDVLLPYYVGQTPATPITNEGGAWMRPNFIAPCAGLYMFTVEFVKDSYYFGGTTDDVSVYLTKTIGNGNPTYVGEGWSGEGAGRRGTGSYSVTLRLGQLDSVQTWVHSDGGPMRVLGYYSFTGYRIAD